MANTTSITATIHKPISSIELLQQRKQRQRYKPLISISSSFQSEPISTINKQQNILSGINEINLSTIVYYQNVNGLLSKRNRIYAEILAADFPIYAFTETALNETIPSHEIFPPNYCVYRCDRTKNTSEKQSKGGTLIAVHNRFLSELISTGESEGCEHLWVKISNGTQNIIIGSLYIPPASKPERYLNNMNYAKKIIDKTNNDTTVILLGDFNLPNLKWIETDEHSNTLIPTNITSEEENIIINSCHDLGLNQINHHHNDNGRLLDLLWTNDPEQCSCNICHNHLLENEVHHKALTLEISFYSKKEPTTKTTSIKDFLGADYQNINNNLKSIEWNNIFAGCSFENKVNKFYEIINDAILNNVNHKIIKQAIHPKWFDKKSINLKNQMNNLHKKFRNNDSIELK